MTDPKLSGAPVFAAGLVIEGTIDGHGHLRACLEVPEAVHMTGTLTIEPDASIESEGLDRLVWYPT